MAGPFDQLVNAFNANAVSGAPDSYPAQQLRQQIALRLMGQQHKYPKNIGEGLSSIGDSIGEAMQMRALTQALAGQEAARTGVETSSQANEPKGPQASNEVTDPVVTASLRPQDEEPAAQPVRQAAPIVAPPPSNLNVASIPMPRQAPEVGPATPNIPTSPGFPASTRPRLDPTIEFAGRTDPTYTPAPSTGPTTRSEAAPWLRAAGEGYDAMQPPDPRAAGINMLRDRMRGSDAGAPTQMASLTGGDVQSDMPLPGITPQALPQRDRIASMLSGGSAALGGPQESAFPPPDQTRLPQLAALQASPDALTSPREAAGNRPIVVPDIAPQPAPQQMAQATMTRPQPLTPQPTPPTQAPGVYDKPIPPDVPKPVPLGPQEQYWKDLADKNEGRGGDPASTAFYRNKEKVYADQRAKEEARNTLQYQSERTLHDQRYRAWEDAQRNFGKTQAETAEAQAKALEAKDAAQITERTGLPAKQVTDKFDVLKKGAEKDAYTIQQLRLAREALDRGIVSGIGGEFRLNMERAKAFFGNKPADELAARSQLYLAAVNSTVGNALQNLQPGDTRVTNSDVIVARGMMGGDPSLQKAAQEKLLGVQMGDVHKRLNEYEGLKDKYLGGLKPEKFYDVQVDPVHANPEVAKAWVDKLIKNQDNYAARERFDKEFGPGAAELEISRARRRSRLGQ